MNKKTVIIESLNKIEIVKNEENILEITQFFSDERFATIYIPKQYLYILINRLIELDETYNLEESLCGDTCDCADGDDSQVLQ